MNKNCHKIDREAIELLSYTYMTLEQLLNNKKLDVLQILFNAIAEDLAIITKDDKSKLEIVDSQPNYQYQKLKEEFQKSRFEHKNKIAKYFTAFLSKLSNG